MLNKSGVIKVTHNPDEESGVSCDIKRWTEIAADSSE